MKYGIHQCLLHSLFTRFMFMSHSFLKWKTKLRSKWVFLVKPHSHERQRLHVRLCLHQNVNIVNEDIVSNAKNGFYTHSSLHLTQPIDAMLAI